MKIVLLPLAKTLLVPLGLTAWSSAINAAIQKKIFGSRIATSTFSNEELNEFYFIDKKCC